MAVALAVALAGRGPEGDRHAHRAIGPGGSGNRQITLIQVEHLPVIAALAAPEEVMRSGCAATWWSRG